MLQINNLEKTIEDLQDQLSEAASRQARVVKEKDAEIQMKNNEIMELKSKMDEMAEEFGEMLRVSVILKIAFYIDSNQLIFYEYRKPWIKCESESMWQVQTLMPQI